MSSFQNTQIALAVNQVTMSSRQFAKGITRCVDCQEIVEIKRGKY